MVQRKMEMKRDTDVEEPVVPEEFEPVPVTCLACGTDWAISAKQLICPNCTASKYVER